MLAQLEGAEASAVAGSGMAALFAAFSAVVKAGDHIIADRSLYGGTYTLLTRQLSRFGIETSFVDLDDADAIRKAHRPATKILHAETLSNPLIRVGNLPQLAKIAHSLGLVFTVDATFSSPALCRPSDWGADLVMHATTKYVGGHSDALGGIVSGRRDLIEAARDVMKVTGLTLGSFDAWLNLRSLKTLALRMKQHSENALALAQWLEQQPQIAQVIYPGLPNHPNHSLASRLMPSHQFGGMLSFDLHGGRSAASALVKRLQLIRLAPSLADVITTISHPASNSHRMLTPQQRQEAGIGDGLLRLSVGLENPQDLITDLAQALDEKL